MMQSMFTAAFPFEALIKK